MCRKVYALFEQGPKHYHVHVGGVIFICPSHQKMDATCIAFDSNNTTDTGDRSIKMIVSAARKTKMNKY